MEKLTPADAAARLGMKRREVIDLIDLPEGTVAVTHDGQQTLIPADGGRPRPYVRPPLGARLDPSTEPGTDHPTEPATEPGAASGQPARRRKPAAGGSAGQ